MKNSLLFYLLTILFSATCFAQFSKTHYIPPIAESQSVPVQQQFLYISTPSTTPVTFNINQIGSTAIAGTVTRDNPFVYDISTGSNFNQFVVEQSSISQVLNNRGYIVEASDMIYVSIRVIDQSGNQSSEVVSKGLAALGTQYRIGGFTNLLTTSYTDRNLTFASILATENNTTVSFSNIKTGAILTNNTTVGNTPSSVTLNSGESYVIAVQGPTNANKDALIGALISSDKPIAVNCGSFGGTNATGNFDLGFDEIVSAERTGSEYIFVKSTGADSVERVLLIANQNNTEIYLNGSTTANYTLNAGQYINLEGSDFSSNGTMYVKTNNTTLVPKTLFAYQCVGDDGRPDQANQEMFFVPPLSCQTPKVIDNIPFIDSIGSGSNIVDFPGRVTITTKTGSALTFIINAIPYTLATLPSSILVTGPIAVAGNTAYECYIMTGFSGNVSVFSTSEVYVAAYGVNGAATFGGYYSGFTFKPEISFQPIVATQSNCIPNVKLSVSSLTGFDTYQWFFNGVAIPVYTSSYTPNATYGPGYYKVKASLTACNIDLESDEIPVSICPTDIDNDGVNDNIDLDSDNDGISNCTESYGNQNINIATLTSGTIAVGTFTNSFTGVVSTSATASLVPITANADGSFVSEVPAGKHNFVEYKMTFTQPMSVGVEYVSTANATDLLNSNAQYVISSNTNKTLTVLNPSNQLLIDTNYDGIYETGITQYSSFEIRFRVNSTTPIAPGTGTFKFLTNFSNSISFKHENLSDSLGNKSTLKFYATCVPKDTDGDGIPNQNDLDSENDGIPDAIEAQGAAFVPRLNVDANHDGMDDAYGTGVTTVDSDTDTVVDYLDLDSDNDGIYDLNESGSGAFDANLNGIIDGSAFGSNGLSDSIETTPDSGVLNFTVANTDADALNNYIDIDSDGDGCNDVIEAGYSLFDSGAGTLGIGNPTVNPTGVVTSGPAYIVPNQDYVVGAPISISVQPQDVVTCENQNATFTITSNTVTSYQWLVFNGITWANVVNNSIYSGATTNSLAISNVSPSMSGYQYKVILLKTGNKCGMISTPATLTTYALPFLTTPITLKQCDDNIDGISVFNLTVNNPQISSNYAFETFTYFTTFTGADSNDQTVKITNPIAYTNPVPFNDVVYVRVENATNCYSIAKINLVVSVTQINATTFHRYFTVCDDSIAGVSSDTDGTSVFDFSSVTNAINSQLPLASSNYTISYYATNADALAQINSISNISAYRNTTLNQMLIYVRVDSNNYQGCFGLGPFVTLTVEALPVANPVNATNIIRHCDDDQDGSYTFDTSTLEASILNGQTNKTVTFYDAAGALISIIPTFTVNISQTITVRVTNNATQASDGPCYDEETLQFVVDKLPQVFTTPAFMNSLVQCDDELDPAFQDGSFPFDTTNYESVLLGSQTGMNIKFTLQNGTVLNHLPSTFSTATQNILVTVTNPLNTSCSTTETLNFVVNPTPRIDLNPNGWANELVCTNLPTFTVTINAGVPSSVPTTSYFYQWYLNNIIIPGAINYSITVSVSGTYSVVVSTALGCSKTRTIQVNSSVIATIDHINIVDLTDVDSVEILVTGSSNGNYVYSIEDPYGPYQTSNFFENVPMGIHTVYIKDLNGCGIAEQTISVLGVPRYFTPNADSYNDTWNIKGVNDQFYSNSIIKIYDRYGKFIKQIAALGAGWDGTYNGQLAPADDYWYSINFDDGRSAKGHFSLKR